MSAPSSDVTSTPGAPESANGRGDGEGEASSSFRPFIPASASPPELTWSAICLGALLGIVFGASSLYLSLKVGLTVSASIPVAVLSIALYRALGRGEGRVLENNIVQTAGSAGESIAFGVGVTMPALMILGYDLDAALFHLIGVPITRVMLVACLGGLLGILMMIPLRRAFIVKQHGTLVYPEGTACAKVLVAGEAGGASARPVIVGLVMAFLYQTLMQGLKLWQDVPARAIRGFKGAYVATEATPALLGVGYIIGWRIAAIMLGGGLLASFVLTPIFAMFVTPEKPLDPTDSVTLLATTQALWAQIRNEYVIYIGAGAVATGGLISLVQSLPIIGQGIVGSLRSVGRGTGRADGEGRSARTGRDLPIWLVALGVVGLISAIASTELIPTDLNGRIVGAVLIVGLGFLFVTVSSRLTGEIGSSSNPISGMTVASLLVTCLVFYLAGWTAPSYSLAALSIAGIVCVASSNGGTTSQDLKTGYLVGATPSKQQLAILVGALTSAIVIGFTLLLLNESKTVVTNKPEHLPKVAAPAGALTGEKVTHEGKQYEVWRVRSRIEKDGAVVAEPGKYLVDPSDNKAAWLVDPGINGRVTTADDGTKVEKFNAPKARLMALIIDGIMRGELPWGLVIIGAFIAVTLQLAGVPALAFSVGVYLPLETSMPIFLGGLVRLLVEKARKSSAEDSDSSPAVLLSSGYIAGGAIAGTLLAFLNFSRPAAKAIDLSRYLPAAYNDSPFPAVIAFALLAVVLALVGLGVLLRDREPAAVEEGIYGHEDAI
jgi:putative OPT family oligopeptide transporter